MARDTILLVYERSQKTKTFVGTQKSRKVSFLHARDLKIQ